MVIPQGAEGYVAAPAPGNVIPDGTTFFERIDPQAASRRGSRARSTVPEVPAQATRVCASAFRSGSLVERIAGDDCDVLLPAGGEQLVLGVLIETL